MKFWPFSRRDLLEQKSLADPDQWLRELFGAFPTNSGVHVTADNALTVPAVSAAVRTISEAAATLDVAVVDRDTSTPIPDHPVTRLLSGDANDWTSGFEIIRDLVADALTRDAGGIAWVNWTNGRVAEVIRLPVGRITVEYDPNDAEPRYRIGSQPVPSQSILHLRPPLGRSPVTLARESIGVAIAMQRHASHLFSRGARPGGIITTPKAVGDTGIQKMLAGWRAAHEGADNAGKTAILWDGAQFQPLALKSTDAQFAELWRFVIEEIARSFNIPAPMIGDLSRATWSNSEQKGREFLSYTLEPWLRALEGALRRALLNPIERQRYDIRFDRDDLSRADLQTRATAISSLISARVLNPNEARSWLDLEPYEGGDEYANPHTGSSQPTAQDAPREERDAA